ncbi:hypothetical protein PRIPAC_71565 [Pristionchus pacificus]|uniref:Uncharacterized protein n=1 Tax=Pristionchus pacificus TaxID=54126 RepID=A0A2A6CG67_PRIPA|nr:hypothetical protein PRIPAC_71565 [Pristionchus pacificus]|eukprot:PDM77053.1 hypothetical protein PRIPAC_42448 [Pristionchus pacificus]
MNYSTPSYHLKSPLSRSGSDLRMMRRSNSFSGLSTSGSSSALGGFTRPSYGYGGGYMAKSLSRSGSTLFGRTLHHSALTTTAPLHSVGVQRSTPHYSDKFPYVRYSYVNTDTALAVTSQIDSRSGRSPGVSDMGTQRWLEGRLNTYNTGLFSRPSRTMSVERPVTPARNYVRYMPVDDAVDMYKKRCMTVGTLSKYWLSPATWASRREKELNLSSATSRAGNFNYTSRYDSRPFASRLMS